MWPGTCEALDGRFKGIGVCRTVGLSAGHTLLDRAVWPPRHYCWKTQGLTARRQTAAEYVHMYTLYGPLFDNGTLGGHAGLKLHRTEAQRREERRMKKGRVGLKGKGRKRRRQRRRREEDEGDGENSVCKCKRNRRRMWRNQRKQERETKNKEMKKKKEEEKGMNVTK